MYVMDYHIHIRVCVYMILCGHGQLNILDMYHCTMGLSSIFFCPYNKWYHQPYPTYKQRILFILYVAKDRYCIFFTNICSNPKLKNITHRPDEIAIFFPIRHVCIGITKGPFSILKRAYLVKYIYWEKKTLYVNLQPFFILYSLQ